MGASEIFILSCIMRIFKTDHSDTLLIGVIYPGIEKYLLDYFHCVELQDTSDFDVLILNDGYENNLPLKNKKVYIVDIKGKYSPAEIRMMGIKYALKKKYRYIVFSDTDDYFTSNRISLSKAKLKISDFVYNELETICKIGIMKNYCANYLKIKGEINSYINLTEKNLFGLTNTAVRVEKLKNLYIPREIIAADWWIFSILLLNGSVGSFIKEATTYYRQYNNNLVGAGKKLSEASLLYGIKVKKFHYKNLLYYCNENGLNEASEIYKKRFDEICELNNVILNAGFRKKYINLINKNHKKIFNGWWSEILPIEEWNKYNE